MNTKKITVTLPSNASGDIFPGNKLTCYRTKLAHPLILDGDWKVALSEIQIPRTWFNITGTTNSLWYKPSQSPGFCLSNAFPITIPPGYYGTALNLINPINKQIKDLHKISKGIGKVELQYDHVRDRILIESDAPYSAIQFPSSNPGLGAMLGFHEFDKWLPADPCSNVKPKVLYAKYPPDMTGGVHGLYVYSDIVDHQYVGDTVAPLLRIVPVEQGFGSIIYKIFDNPDYIPVSRNRIDTIEIDIRSDSGEPLIFEYGKVIVKLHFRLDTD